MFEELIKIADELDSLGLSEKADAIDNFLNKLAESGMHTVPTYVADDDMEEEDEEEDGREYDDMEKISPAEIIEAIKELNPEEKMEVFSWLLREEIESFDSEMEEEESESDEEEDDFEFEEEDSETLS